MSSGDMAALEQTTLARMELDSRSVEQPFETGLVARLRARDLTAFDDLVRIFERPVYALWCCARSKNCPTMRLPRPWKSLSERSSRASRAGAKNCAAA